MAGFKKKYQIRYRYINFPIRNHAPKHTLQLIVDEVLVREFSIELAIDGPRQWWAHYDVSAFRGKTVVLKTCDTNLADSQIELLSQLITQSDEMLVVQDLYRERYRPQLHFTPRRGWNNDPNGLVYLDGVWHLFFQHNPLGIGWGNMHWGHATSRDLLHWEEQPIALFPRSLADMAYSGGGLVDTLNTSGFGIAAEEPFILSFTSTGRGECLAFSLDRGRNFQEYNGNPVLLHEGRDPKIIWYRESKKWVMIVYDESEGKRGYSLFDSKDLREWQYLQHVHGWYECPEMFELPLENGEPGERKWVIYGSIYEKLRSAFQIGDFDGNKIRLDDTPQRGHAGPQFYAAQVFSNAPNDRKIMLGWLSDAIYPDMPFGHGMSIPLELSLRRSADEIRLCFYPISEMEKLRIATIFDEHTSVDRANELFACQENELLDIELEIKALSNDLLQFYLRDFLVVYDPEKKQVTFSGQTVSCQPGKELLHLRVIIDRSVTEVFIDQGWGAFAAMTIFSEGSRRISLEGSASVKTIKLCTLRSIWED